ncbi:hypothetical protein KEM48_013868 [Puccinia striiformis f. sp. tritici PST-130]|nr:hypothetical protein KEM48_013868 [Puccinia striiformis f. sp. tritici PST-130]
MAETFLENRDDDSSNLASPILPDKGPFSELRDSLPSFNQDRKNVPEANPGVALILVNSRATSLALASGMSTPVPLPVDRLTVPPTETTMPEDLNTPSNQGTASPLVTSETPMMADRQLDMCISMFHTQRDLYETARRNFDIPVMKVALLQAVLNQDLIRRQVGEDQMFEICEDWAAEVELDIVLAQERAMERAAANPRPASTQAHNSPSRPILPQVDTTMAYQVPIPAQMTALTTSSNSPAPLVVQAQEQAPVPTLTASSVQNSANA